MPATLDHALDRTLLALAAPVRRALIDRLRQSPCRPAELANDLALSRPAVSRHLKILREAGLVDEVIQADDARTRLVSLRLEPFTELRGWVEDVEAFWDDQLQAFKRHAESRYGAPGKREREEWP